MTAEPGSARRWLGKLPGLSLRVKVLLWSATLVVGSGILGSVAVWSAMSGELLLREQEQLSGAAADAALGYTAVVGTLQQDALMIASAPAVQGLIRVLERGDISRAAEVSREFWAVRTGALLKSLLQAKPIFREARLFQGDTVYQELLRVEREGGSITVGLDDQVPARNDRPDLREAFRPGSGAVILSDIELNRQQGQVEMPPRPVLHVIVPLRDSTNLPFGLIVFTADLRTYLAGIPPFALSNTGVRVLNARGRFLVHPDPAKVLSQAWQVEDEYPGFGATFGPSQLQRVQHVIKDQRGEDQVLGVHDVTMASGPTAHRIRFLYSARYTDIRDQALAGNWRAVISTLLAIALALPLALILGTAMVRPLQRITAFITSWTPGTVFTGLPTDRADEIGVLAREFSHLLASLEERQATLEEESAERRQAEEAASHAEKRHREVIETLNDGLTVSDAHGNIISINPAAERMFGYPAGELIGQPVSVLAPTARRQQIEGSLVTMGSTGSSLGGKREMVGQRRNGEVFPIELMLNEFTTQDGRFFCAVMRDLSDQKVAEAERQRLVGALHCTTDSVEILDRGGCILYANPAYERRTGHRLAEIRGSRPEAIMSYNEDQQTYREMLDAVHAGQAWSGVLRSNNTDGIPRSEDVSISPIKDAEGQTTSFVVLMRDITRRKEIEAEVHRMATALDATDDGVVITDTNGVIQYVNPAVETFSGLMRADIIGKDSRQFFDARVPPSETAGFVAAMTAKQPWKGLMTTTLRDGRCRHENVSLSPMRDATGTVTHWISVRHDVTKQHQMEAELRQAQKLESIGQLAAGIAHEINTPTQYVGDNIRFVKDAFTELNVLLGTLISLSSGGGAGGENLAQALTQALGSADLEFLRAEVPRALEQSADGCQRISGIVKAMKDFSHPGQDKTPVDLNRAIASTVTVASNEWKYVAEMQTDFDAQLPPVVCLPGEFNQVILNMLVNAAHAITDVVGEDGRGKGTITVTTRQVDGFAEVRISDTGTGIAPEIREKIFDPFFTTKQVGKGTGQGLAIAYDVVVNKHGGTIALESEPGKGSTFIIRLPLDETRSVAAVAA